MSIPKFAVTRPVTMLMFFCSVVLLGAVSLKRLPVELMPSIAYKKISIRLDIRGGMPPTEVETLVTKPVEGIMGTLTNLENIQSTSKKGRCIVVLKFKPGTDMDFATMETREKFAKIENILPKEMEKPVIAKYEESDVPVMIVAVTAIDPRYTPEILRRVVDTQIKQVIQRVPGVANVEVGGGRERKIMVEFDLHKLQKYNIPILKIVNSIGTSNLNLMAGKIEQYKNNVTIRTIGQFSTVDNIKQLPVMITPAGSVIRLKDIADVKDSYNDAESHSRVNNSPVVSLYIQKESTGNTIKVCLSVEKALDKLWPKLDPNIRKVIVSDQASFISDAINTVKDNLFRGAIIAVFVLLGFLGGTRISKLAALICIPISLFIPTVSLVPVLFFTIAALSLFSSSRPTLIIAISIPTSLLLTFTFMLVKGITLNTMTLTGLALATGMLVDNSIVVLDNIDIHKSRGLSSKEASIKGTQEVILPIIASTITTIVVFVPFVFVTEQIKLLYGSLAQTVVFSLIASLIVAVTLIPVMISRLAQRHSTPVARSIIHRWYKGILIKSIRLRYVVFGIPLILLAIALILSQHLETQFLGTTEENKFTIFIELPDGAKLDMSDKTVKAVEKFLKKTEKTPSGGEKLLFPEIKNISSWVKGWSNRVYVELVPRKERERSTKEVIEAIRPYMNNIQDIAISPTTGEKTFIYFSEPKGTGTNELFVNVYGHDYKKLHKLAYEIAGRMQGIKGLTDVKIRITQGRPELDFKIDKVKARQFGLTVKDIADTVHCEIRGLRATLFHTKGKEVETIGRLKEKFRRYRKDMPYLSIDTPMGQKVFLAQVSNFVSGTGPSEIWHIDKRRMIQVSAATGRIPMAVAVEKIKKTMNEIKLPKDFFWEFGGDYYKMLENRQQLMLCMVLTVLLVYMVLGSLFESYIQPFIIMLTVPLALIGAVFVLKITNKPVSMGVLIGGIMLAGIVVNNAIILVDRINILRQRHYNLLHAILITGQERLRPIAMTTSTTVLALIPMAMDKSEAAGLWAPLAVTVIGGLTFSTLLTLVIVPIIYIMIEDVKRIFRQ